MINLQTGFNIAIWDVLIMNFGWQLLSQIPSADVALITAGPFVKAVTNYKQVRVGITFNHIACEYMPYL